MYMFGRHGGGGELAESATSGMPCGMLLERPREACENPHAYRQRKIEAEENRS
jgi:hypothetical protein